MSLKYPSLLQPPNAWVVIHNLKTCRDGAILDPDDRLNDVADDREQIIATFEEGNCSSNGAHLQQNDSSNQDGTSLASDSLGTESPDVPHLSGNSKQKRDNDFNRHESSPPSQVSNNNDLNLVLQCNDVEITEDEINTCISVPLQVRRGSEPVLNRLSPIMNDPIDLSKRWSTAVALDSKDSKKGSADSLQGDSIPDNSEEETKSPIFAKKNLSPKSVKEEGYASEEKSENTPSSATSSSTFSRFSRGSGRLSMVNSNIDVWVEAADRQLIKMKNENNVQKATDLDSNKEKNSNECVTKVLPLEEEKENYFDMFKKEPVIFRIKSERGPLGIHVVPFCDKNGQENGIVIQGIERDGKIARDGRLKVGDVIVEINGRSLANVKFQEAQEIFKQALSTPEIVLVLYQNQNALNAAPPPPPPPNASKRPPPPPLMPKPNPAKEGLESGMVEGEERGGQLTKVATLTQTKKLTPAYGLLSQKTPLNVAANTRKIGRKYHIRLTKGADGLGFSITTRDNPAGGNCPIYIKTILPKGAAIQDGRLKPGDRLLEMNGVEMTNKSHMEAVKLLRNIPLGCSVDLIVSRQEPDPSPSPKLPRQLPPESSADVHTGRQREVLTFEIPLNDTGSAGLGVSVKGKTCAAPEGNNVDLGIFVKSVFHGGAAFKDGRLQPNDQLISINGIPLLGIPNGEAMETLRRAMTQCEGPDANPNAITLTVARRVSYSSKNITEETVYHQRNGSIISTDSCGEEQMLAPLSKGARNDVNFDVLNESQNSFKSSEATVIFNPKELNTSSSKSLENHLCQKHPVSDRLTGQESPSPGYSAIGENLNNRSPSKTPTRIDVIIEGDQENDNSNSSYLQNSPKCSKHIKENNDSNLEISNLIEDAGFQRDGFGRQSISEKRHAQLDAKNTDTYKRNKKAKEERDKNRQEDRNNAANCESKHDDAKELTRVQPHDEAVGPALGMRKSSSLESLQTMMQELQKEQLESRGGNPFAGPRPATLKVSRSRGTNESFRAAVDKSYDAPGNVAETMETVAEEGSESGSSINPTNAANIITSCPSGALSTASTHYTAVSSATTASSQVTGVQEDDKKQFLKKKSSKKKGLFKSFFKFRSKKGKNSCKTYPKEMEEDIERLKARQAAQLEQERIQEHYKRLVEQQKQEAQAFLAQFQSDSNLIPSQPLHSTPTQGCDVESASSAINHEEGRQERMQQLRNQHQRLHAERLGQYPKSEQDKYDRDMREIRHETEVIHTRTNSYEICKEAMERPGSRVGIADLNNKYSHYMNYREIQQHLEKYNQDHVKYHPRAQLNVPVESNNQNKVAPQQRMASMPLVSGRRKTERPLSGYDYRTSGVSIQNASIYEQQLERQLMPKPQQSQSQVQYGIITRNGVNCSSFPRRQVVNKMKHLNETTIVPMQNSQPIYESRHVSIYGSNYHNGVGYSGNIRPSLHPSYQASIADHRMPQYYHSSRHQRELQNQSQPGSNV
ncbi:partitioning defective 3-like protein [Dinothrombium tinctorium]|uniref:Partitioning defective 3-like protein n=1 Tax=Dinothrombium tinctorium TaxID=1965070 RepID=A0A443R0I3_9ACAR|nr:partitioning defective 3-like protein [Dinothrombium tinctorium]